MKRKQQIMIEAEIREITGSYYRQFVFGDFRFDCLDSMGATKIEEGPNGPVATWAKNSPRAYQTEYRCIKPSEYHKLAQLWTGPENSNIVFFDRNLFLKVKTIRLNPPWR